MKHLSLLKELFRWHLIFISPYILQFANFGGEIFLNFISESNNKVNIFLKIHYLVIFFHVRVTYLQCFTDAYGLWFIFLTKWYIIMHQLSAIVFLVLITIEGRKKPIWHEPRDKTVCNLIEKQTKQPNSWLVFQ